MEEMNERNKNHSSIEMKNNENMLFVVASLAWYWFF